MKYYKVVEMPMWDIKGWKVAADTKEDALGLALRRSDGWVIEDVESCGNVSCVLGSSDSFEDVMNFRDKIDAI